MNTPITSGQLLEDFLEEKHALGFKYRTDEAIIRRFLRDFREPPDGQVTFSKEYVLQQVITGPNRKKGTVCRDINAINGFLDFVKRKGFQAYTIPKKFRPKEPQNFSPYIFTDMEIENILKAADSIPYSSQSPLRHIQFPVMFRILFNCGLRGSEMLHLRRGDVDLENNCLVIHDAKFHKDRLVPFSEETSEAIRYFMEKFPDNPEESYLFISQKTGTAYTMSGLHTSFLKLLRLAGIPHGGRGKGPRLHDIRHSFAVHCLNNWVKNGLDLGCALPVLSRYLGHKDLQGTQRYLRLTSDMYPEILERMEAHFGCLIPENREGQDEKK